MDAYQWMDVYQWMYGQQVPHLALGQGWAPCLSANCMISVSYLDFCDDHLSQCPDDRDELYGDPDQMAGQLAVTRLDVQCSMFVD